MEMVTGSANNGPDAAGPSPPEALGAETDGAGAGASEEADEQPASMTASSAARHSIEMMVWKHFFIEKLLSVCAASRPAASQQRKAAMK